MSSETRPNRLTALLLIPSFYGSLTWGVWLCLYLMRLIRVDRCAPLTLALYLAVQLFFVGSLLTSYPRYRRVSGALLQRARVNGATPRRRLPLSLALLHLCGFAGLALWLIHLSGYLGGADLALAALTGAAGTIRGDAELSGTFGIQLSYLGWLAVGLTVFSVAKGELSRWWLTLPLLQWLGNFLYLGRTQPVWIACTALLMALAARPGVRPKRVLLAGAALLVLLVALFWGFAEWTGKSFYEEKFDDALIPGITQVMYAYGVSGFAYFDRILSENEQVAYRPQRVIYPLNKLLSRVGVAEEPESQLLDFYHVPFETNVGTFLEPFYRDGGILFLFLGVLVYTFGLDLLGSALLGFGGPLPLYAWANLCYTSFIAFFTPQLTQLPVWLFTALGVAPLALSALYSLMRQEALPESPQRGGTP